MGKNIIKITSECLGKCEEMSNKLKKIQIMRKGMSQTCHKYVINMSKVDKTLSRKCLRIARNITTISQQCHNNVKKMSKSN